jgi:hypothetical protein
MWASWRSDRVTVEHNLYPTVDQVAELFGPVGLEVRAEQADVTGYLLVLEPADRAQRLEDAGR